MGRLDLPSAGWPGGWFTGLQVTTGECHVEAMKWFTRLMIMLICWAGILQGIAQTKPASKTRSEPVVAALEPIALRTALARILPDAKRTVIVPAREDALLGLTHFSKEEFAATGMDWDQFMKKAADAATRLLISIKPAVVKDSAGQIAYVKLESERPFVASIIYSPRLIPLFQDTLGDRLVALMPDRHTVYLFPRNFGEFQAFGQKIIDDHTESVYPCSIEAFEISRNGVKCIGGFDDGADPTPDAAEAAAAVPKGKPRPELAPPPKVPSKIPRRTEAKDNPKNRPN